MWYVNNVLTAEQERDGLRVLEDEHFVYVQRSGETRLVLSAQGATTASIRAAVEAAHLTATVCA